MFDRFSTRKTGAAVLRSSLGGALLGACLGLSGAVQAGAVSTSFDPLFGSALPDLSYAGGISFNIADSCLGASASGIRTVTLAGACKTNASAHLKLFDADDLSDSVEASFGLKVNSLTVLDNIVVGWDTNLEVFSNLRMTNFLSRLLGASVYGSNPYINVGAAKNNDFSFKYATGGVPQLTCLYCNGDLFSYVLGGYEGAAGQPAFSQQISYTNDARVTSKVVMTLNGSTPQYAMAVPEPGSVALIAAGFAAIVLTRRRRKS